MNCGAVTGQLLGLVSPKTANEMTQLQQGSYLGEWVDYASKVIGSPLTIHTEPITEFTRFFTYALFPGFGTLVLTLPVNDGVGHYFVVGKSNDNRIVILDPQTRRGNLQPDEYFSQFSPPHKLFRVLFRDVPKTAKQHENDAISFLAPMMEKCNISSGEVYMEEDTPQTDVEMSAGRRKKRKTKRRLLAKRTLRRVNRRRRVI